MNLVSSNMLKLDVSAEMLTLKPPKAKPHYQLADPMSQFDLSASELAELAAWNSMPAIGRKM